MFRKKTTPKGKKRKSRVRWFPGSWFLDSFGFRLFILLFTTAVLSFMLNPILPRSVPPLKTGAIAPKDIKADRDFLMEDRASTEKRRLEAAEGVRPVYDYDRQVPTMIGMVLANAFLEMSHRPAVMEEAAGEIPLREKTDPGGMKKDFEALLGIPLLDREFQVLGRYGFTIDKATDLVRIVYSPYRIGPISLESLPVGKSILVRDIKTGKEEIWDDLKGVLTMENARKNFREQVEVRLSQVPPDLREVYVSLGGKVLKPSLTFARNATEKRRQLAMDEVKPVFYKVQAGEMIVREGEKITAGHLDRLHVLGTHQSDNLIARIIKSAGTFLMILLFTIVLYFILKIRWRPSSRVNADLLFLALLSLLMVFFVKTGLFVARSLVAAFPQIPLEATYFAIPFVTGTMIVVILLRRDAGLVFSLFFAFLTTFLFESRFPMFFYVLSGGIIAAFRVSECHERSVFYRAGAAVGLANMAVILCLSLLENTLLTMTTVVELACGFLSGLLSGILAGSLVPLLEFLFGYTTDIKLLELANLNQPIFQRMTFLTPGTYHHSIVVGSMVEAAAEAIDANALLAKVSAYYHDIGKMKKPLYFVENQQKWEDRHQKLSPKMSSLVIISHVKEGCEMARELHLGRLITDIIRQHHGTRLVAYFYDKARKDRDSSIRSIPESDFRYPGPKPQTKEAALVLLGDVIEASSRALNNPTPSRIRNLVENRIQEILHEGELDDSDLTFRDLRNIEESFTRILMGIFHQRIDYPALPPPNRQNGRKERNGHPHRQPLGKNAGIFEGPPSGPH